MRRRERALEVAGVRVAVRAPAQLALAWPPPGLETLAVDAREPELELRVRLGTPVAPPGATPGPRGFARRGAALAWVARRAGRCIAAARLDAGRGEAEVVWDPAAFEALPAPDPTAGGLAAWLVMHRLVARGGLVLDACGVVHDGQGVVFAGGAEGATSALARVLQRYGCARVMSRERVAVERRGPQPRLYAWPFQGEVPTSLASAPLRVVHRIRRAPLVLGEPLVGTAAADALRSCAVRPLGDAQSDARVDRAATELAAEVPVVRLGFAEDERIVRYAFGPSAVRELASPAPPRAGALP